MIPKECKRLAEVDFPIAVVSKHSAREKSIRHGHPSTLHLWWARRPLAACRAMLLALLLPDPCDNNCPDEFKRCARNILSGVQGSPGASSPDLRNELLRFLGDFADWGNSASPIYLEAARGLVRAAHGDESPLVVDPFAGGGSIPLEALRIGCDTFASDLNPIACMLLKTLLRDIPEHSHELPEEVRRVGEEIASRVEQKLDYLYPLDADGAKPIAYLWARTIVCDSCGAELPLVRAFWLSKKSNRLRALRYSVHHDEKKPPVIRFEIFEPKKDSDVPKPTVSRAKAVCLCCNVVMPPERVRLQIRKQNGGANPIFDSGGARIGGALLLAVAFVDGTRSGRDYRLPTSRDYQAVREAEKACSVLETELFPNGAPLLPNESTPKGGGSGASRAFSIQAYGMMEFKHMFTWRQLLALSTFCKVLAEQPCSSTAKEILALAVSRFSDICNSLLQWKSTSTQVVHMFTRQALSMVWDFPEPSIFGEASGDFRTTLGSMVRVIEQFPETTARATVQLADATGHPLPDESCSVWFTDPPYYDAIPYSDLSDFFFVWLKRCLPNHPFLRDPFDSHNPLSPKSAEIVQDETKSVAGVVKDKAFFEQRMSIAFAEGRRQLKPDAIGCVVFAHKTTEGWEALLTGMINGGLVITGSWPIRTEMGARLRAKDSAALATSVHLVCRPRLKDAAVGDWSDVLRDLPSRVGDWVERLQSEGIRGADLVFACIGPAMEVYSRYRRVEDAEGREIPLGGDPTAPEPYKRGFLAYVWETVGRMALEQVLGTAEAKARNGAAGALEEDSRLTALFLWTLQSTEVKDGDAADENGESEPDVEEDDEESPKKKKTGYTLIYDVARRFAQPLGIHLDKWEGRIVETDKGIVRLLPVAERATQLFGDADAAAMARRIEQDVKAQRNYTFAFMQDAGAAPQIKTGKGRKSKKDSAEKAEPPAPQQVTTLDRVHAAMLLQSSGQTNGLRALLREEQQRGPDFIRLANALSALYPKESEEKRLLDAMLLAVPRN